MSEEFIPPPLLGVVEVEPAEQIAESVIFAIDGFGLTETDTVNVDPTHDPDFGVTV